MSTDLHLHLPDLLSAQLVAAHEAGYYDSGVSFPFLSSAWLDVHSR